MCKLCARKIVNKYKHTIWQILPASAQDIDVALEDRSHEDLENSNYQVSKLKRKYFLGFWKYGLQKKVNCKENKSIWRIAFEIKDENSARDFRIPFWNNHKLEKPLFSLSTLVHISLTKSPKFRLKDRISIYSWWSVGLLSPCCPTTHK